MSSISSSPPTPFFGGWGELGWVEVCKTFLLLQSSWLINLAGGGRAGCVFRAGYPAMGALTRTNAIHAPHLLARSHEKGGVRMCVCEVGGRGVVAAFMKDATKGRHSSGGQRQSFGPGPTRAVSCTLALFVTSGASVLSACSFYFTDVVFCYCFFFNFGT